MLLYKGLPRVAKSNLKPHPWVGLISKYYKLTKLLKTSWAITIDMLNFLLI